MDRFRSKANRQIVRWLYLGVFMLVFQILLGGITRLTESGLSITEWKPITGTLPPLNTAEWQVEFDKYKNTDQFKYVHSDFSLSDFKYIFFWEWLHRTWARLMGLVFLFGFFYFLIRKKFTSGMVIPLIILFVLGIVQGGIGWIMVQSGLVPEKMFVGHIHLAAHFIAALVLLCYTWWFALSLSVPPDPVKPGASFRTLTATIVFVLFLQLIYGAFMAGLHAAVYAPTWPTINGQWVPKAMDNLSPAWKNIFDNRITVQFIHRGFAYLLGILVLVWWLRARKLQAGRTFQKTIWLPPVLILMQIILGIFTVTLSPVGNNLIYFGVAHQLGAMLFLMSIIFMWYLMASNPEKAKFFI